MGAGVKRGAAEVRCPWASPCGQCAHPIRSAHPLHRRNTPFAPRTPHPLCPPAPPAEHPPRCPWASPSGQCAHPIRSAHPLHRRSAPLAVPVGNAHTPSALPTRSTDGVPHSRCPWASPSGQCAHPIRSAHPLHRRTPPRCAHPIRSAHSQHRRSTPPAPRTPRPLHKPAPPTEPRTRAAHTPSALPTPSTGGVPRSRRTHPMRSAQPLHRRPPRGALGRRPPGNAHTPSAPPTRCTGGAFTRHRSAAQIVGRRRAPRAQDGLQYPCQ
jgi:hypothetical protein